MTAIFRIAPDHAGTAQIICEACGGETRYWDEKQAARWKTAHANGCPADPQTVLNARRNSRSRR